MSHPTGITKNRVKTLQALNDRIQNLSEVTLAVMV